MVLRKPTIHVLHTPAPQHYFVPVCNNALQAVAFLCTIILLSTSKGSAAIPQTLPAMEVDALLAFKANYISMATQHLLHSWNASNTTHICDSWLGIVCTQSRHHIQEINLSDIGLSGAIAPHFGNLTSLTVLDLSNNSFSGTLPPQLQGCTLLEKLDLQYNELTGPIPSSLTTIVSLQRLNLCRNSLDGPIPLGLFMNGNVSNLQFLGLCSNAFTGSMPVDLGLRLPPRLTYLLLGQNNLTGSIPPSLGKCLEFIGIQLSDNQLEGPIPAELGSLRELQALHLYGNTLTGSIPASLANCTALVELLLADNHLTGLIPPQFGDLRNLQLIGLQRNKLGGSIPPSLSNCTSLLKLSFLNNHLTGPIPPQFGDLRNLQIIDLRGNKLGGSISPSLGNCTRLVELGLSDNQLTGHIPSQLGLLPKLQWLVLSTNNLTGPIPPRLGNCTNLTYLYLGTNQLTGSIPSQFGSIHSIQFLYLYENNITGHIPPSLGNCTNLIGLELNFNQLIGQIPAELQFNSHLQSLSLAKNQLTGGIPPGLGNCTELVKFQLAFNQLSSVIPPKLGLAWSNLQILYAYGNNFTGSIPSSLGNCTNLLGVDLGSNQLSGSIPPELRNWGQLQMLSLPWNFLSGSLEVLDVSNFTQLYSAEFQFNEMSGPLSNMAFSRLQQLQYLDLGSNRFTGEIPWDSLSLCTSLFNLSLAYNHLTGEILHGLGKLENLKRLYLQGNLLHGGVPDLEGSKLSLLELDLSSNQLNGSLPASLAHVVKTVAGALKLSDNSFSGSLPLWLGQLVMAQSIDLSINHFTGGIPKGLGDCVALTSLDLSQNQLSGELPLNLGNLDYLETLNLAFNDLSGVLPPFLSTKLTRLRQLNVSFNHFTGPIPAHKEGVFRYLNASSFLGNPGLCGPVLNKECISASFTEQGRHHRHNAISLTNWTGVLLMALSCFFAMVVLLLLVVLCYRKSLHVKTIVDQGMETDTIAAKRFSAQELMKATQGYAEVNLLGQGGSSEVFKGVLEDGSIVAVKVLKDVCKGSSLDGAFLQELKILSKLKHRNLVQILGVVRNLDVQALVLEYMGNGCLETFLGMHQQQQLTSEGEHMAPRTPMRYWEVLSAIAIDIAEALTYLHREYGDPIIHGDVKPSNILFDTDWRPRLADFGLAKLVKRDAGSLTLSSSFKGSIGYMAPEYAYAARITTKVDVYAYGVVLLRMLTGVSPTHSILDGQSLHEWVRRKLPTDEDGDSSINALLLDAALVQMNRSGTYTKLVEQLLRIGVACTSDRPDDRPAIHQVLALLTSYNYKKDLTNVTTKLLGSTTHGPAFGGQSPICTHAMQAHIYTSTK